MVACDPWCFCLDDSLLDRSTGQQGQEGTPPPVLCLLSEEWVGNKERFAVDALLRATHRRGRLRACYEMPGTVHQSASDTPLWLPGRPRSAGRRAQRPSLSPTVSSVPLEC